MMIARKKITIKTKRGCVRYAMLPDEIAATGPWLTKGVGRGGGG